jgi:hypothetical protein
MQHNESEFNANPRSESQQGNRAPAPKLIAADYQSGEQLAHRTVGDVADYGFPNLEAHAEKSSRTVMPVRDGDGKQAPKDFGFPEMKVQDASAPKALDRSTRRAGDELREMGFPPLTNIDFSRAHRDVRNPPSDISEKPKAVDKAETTGDAASEKASAKRPAELETRPPVKVSDSFRETSKLFDQLKNLDNPAAVVGSTIRAASALAPELRAAGKNDEIAGTLFSQATTKIHADHADAAPKLLRGLMKESLSANPESPEPHANWTTPRRMNAITRRSNNGS